jgi:hypothetical protein
MNYPIPELPNSWLLGLRPGTPVRASQKHLFSLISLFSHILFGCREPTTPQPKHFPVAEIK